MVDFKSFLRWKTDMNKYIEYEKKKQEIAQKAKSYQEYERLVRQLAEQLKV